MNEEKKSFWARPEGKTGLVTIVAGIAGLYFLGPFVAGLLATAIGIVGNTIVLGGLITAAVLMVAFLMNPQVHTIGSILFKQAMRWFTDTFIIQIDPIGVMRTCIDKFKNALETMTKSIAKLAGEIKSIEAVIIQNKSEAKTAISSAKSAHEQGKVQAFRLNSRKAGRREESTLQLEDALGKMKFLHTMLLKFREATTTVIEDMSDEVDVHERKRKAMLASYSAMKAAKSVLSGNGDTRELFDRSIEFAANDYNAKFGEIESFMTDQQAFMDGLDIQNGQFDAEALEKIKQWEQMADSLVLGSTPVVKSVSTERIVQPRGYSDLLNRN